MGEDGDIANMLVMAVIFTFAQGLGGYLLERLVNRSPSPEPSNDGDDHSDEVLVALVRSAEAQEKLARTTDRNLKAIAKLLDKKGE